MLDEIGERYSKSEEQRRELEDGYKKGEGGAIDGG